MDFKKEFVTNKQLEEEGVWVDIGDGGELKIARDGNPKAMSVMRDLSKPFVSQIRLGKLPQAKADEITIKTMAQTILLDWKGISYGGKPLQYSVENAIKLLTESEDFRTLVSTLSNDRKTFQQEIEEIITKN